jgi:hypothetical protein
MQETAVSHFSVGRWYIVAGRSRVADDTDCRVCRPSSDDDPWDEIENIALPVLSRALRSLNEKNSSCYFRVVFQFYFSEV